MAVCAAAPAVAGAHAHCGSWTRNSDRIWIAALYCARDRLRRIRSIPLQDGGRRRGDAERSSSARNLAWWGFAPALNGAEALASISYRWRLFAGCMDYRAYSGSYGGLLLKAKERGRTV